MRSPKTKTNSMLYNSCADHQDMAIVFIAGWPDIYHGTSGGIRDNN
jgi:hypothetical protein